MSLLNITKNWADRFIEKWSALSIIIVYNFVILINAVVFYPLVPFLLNYPANNEQVSRYLGTSNSLQYLIILVSAALIGTLYLLKSFKGLNHWRKLDATNAADLQKIKEIRRKCINIPYAIFMGQILIINIPLIPILIFVSISNKLPIMAPLKIFILVFSFFSLAAVISHIFAKRIFKVILLRTHHGNITEGIRIALHKKIIIQILPMFVIAILLMGLVGYSRLINEKGDLIYSTYKDRLEEITDSLQTAQTPEQAMNILEKINFDNTKAFSFVVTPNGEIHTSNQATLGGYLKYFIEHPYHGDRIFNINAENQGVVIPFKHISQVWKAGVIFNVVSYKAVTFFILGIFILLVINFLVLYYFSKSLSNDISQVADNLRDIADEDSVNLDRCIPVTSNDEIADLVIAFNKIQNREKTHIQEVREQQAILVEKERLASLGHLIGGIAHNLRTPIMSLAGAIEGLKDLIQEYDESIDDPNVNREDHHAIAQEMRTWIEKMQPYCSYMSDIIGAVKGQTVQSGESSVMSFSMGVLKKRIELLLEQELKKHRCVLNFGSALDLNFEITGDLSALVQVLSNIIVNAVDAYGDKKGTIDFVINKSDSMIEFIIHDNAGGMAPEVQRRLFKEMVTTKGTKGTGLGLYISYSSIKARFGGDVRFESEHGKGTTFYIRIPF